MSEYPAYPNRRKLDLAGFWDFHFLPESECKLKDLQSVDGFPFADILTVPGCFDFSPAYFTKRGIGLYRKRLSLPAGSYRLEIGGVTLGAKIFLNGKYAATDDLPYSFFCHEFTADSGTLEIVIAVENSFDDEEHVLFGKDYDFYAAGGILRSIMLYALPEDGVVFERCRITTLDLETGRIRLEADVRGIPDGKCPLPVRFDDAAAAQSVEFCFADGTGTAECIVPDHRIWSPESPNLHVAELSCPGHSDVLQERFGIRTIAAKAGQILLNGKPVFLAGYNRHESHPDFGYATPPSLQIADLQILKSLHCNFIRGAHYPQSQEFLELCDKTGFLVWEESLGWGNGSVFLNRETFRKKQVEQTELMVQVSYNHPSVIMWGFLNENHSSLPEARTLIAELAGAVKRIDPARLVTFASMQIGYGEQSLDLVDVIACNTYPGWYIAPTTLRNYHPDQPGMIAGRLDEVEREISAPELKDRPLILSEIGASALYGYHDRGRVPWSEEFQADYVAEVCRQVKLRPRIQGLALWQFADTKTYVATGSTHSKGFNNKGSLDEYRNEKKVCEVVRREFPELLKEKVR